MKLKSLRKIKGNRLSKKKYAGRGGTKKSKKGSKNGSKNEPKHTNKHIFLTPHPVYDQPMYGPGTYAPTPIPMYGPPPVSMYGPTPIPMYGPPPVSMYGPAATYAPAYGQIYYNAAAEPTIKSLENSWEKSVKKNPDDFILNEDSIWTKLDTYLPPDFTGTDEEIVAKRNVELNLLKTLCFSNDHDKCEIIKKMIPRYKTGHADSKKNNTICVLLFIISLLTVILKDNCRIIIKGGFAVEAAISKIPETENNDPALEEHFKTINAYSTNDIDILIVPKDGQSPLYYAQQITNMIMWIFNGHNSKIHKLSVLDKSMEVNPLQQIIKLSIDEKDGRLYKYTAVMDINFNVNDENFYLPNGTPIFHTQTIVVDKDTKESRIIHLALEVVSSHSLVLDRMFHLILYKYPAIANKEKLDMLIESLGNGTVDPDYANDEIYRLSTVDPFNSKYIASVEKSLKVLLAASCILRKDEKKSKKEIFDAFLKLIKKTYPHVVIDKGIEDNIERTLSVA
jgi:hypothetical protein